MMTSALICPNCGAGIAPGAAICAYCGTAFTDAPDMTWKRVDRQLPPPDPERPGCSVSVIVLSLSDGLTFVNKKTKEVIWWYDFMEFFLISGYYNFDKKVWANDIYGKRLSKKFSPLLEPTHWMFIPAADSKDWIRIEDKYPPIKNIPDARWKDGILPADVKVLACCPGPGYKESVISAQFTRPPFAAWNCYDIDGDVPTGPDVPVNDMLAWHKIQFMTHWMSYPPGPKE